MIDMILRLVNDQQKATGEYGDHLDKTIRRVLDYSAALSEDEMEEVQAARLDPGKNLPKEKRL